MFKNLQSLVANAVSLHRAVNKSELGKDAFDAWTELELSLSAPAYAVYAATHDAAGLPAAIVDADAVNAARSALAKALRPVVAAVGKVSFAGMEGEALLDVNAYLLDTVAGISWKRGWTYSDEVKAIDDSIRDAKDALSIACKWAEYYALGDNKTEQAKYAEQIAALEGRIAALKASKSDAEKKVNGKVRAYVPQDETEFRKDLEKILLDCICRRHSEDYAAYKAKEAEKKAKRKAKAAENRKAKKDIEKKMAELSK